jgi:hypothetical protein
MVQSQSYFVSPYFDDTNYAYGKDQMRAFIKTLEEHVWMSFEKSWNNLAINIDTWSKDE